MSKPSTGEFHVVALLLGIPAWVFEFHIKSLTSTGEKTQQLWPQVIYLEIGWRRMGKGRQSITSAICHGMLLR